MIARVDYVILYVAHLDRSIAFYRQLIGLQLKVRDHGYAEFVTEGTNRALRVREAAGAHRTGRACWRTRGEIAFLVSDVDGKAVRLRAAGAEILAGPTDRPWGHRTLHLLDPDGFVVELVQEIKRARQQNHSPPPS
jgi:lactoylglutathione lyase